MSRPLQSSDVKFIEKRRWFVTRWNLVGSGMFGGLVLFVAWMFWAHPRLVNPLQVLNELQTGRIPPSTLEIMAAMLPIAVLALLLMLAVFMGFAFAIIGNERRYLNIIDRLQTENDPGE